MSEGALERLILTGRDAAGLMLIIDYAESRQEDVIWLADRLVSRAETISTPTRMVLLSRGSGVWWRELLLKSQSLQDLCSLGGETSDEVTIPEEIALRDRRALFDASAAAFREHGGALTADASALRPPSDDLVSALETENDYDRPLAVQIAALLYVAGVDAGEGRQGMASLLEKILGLEYEHWDKALNIGGKPNMQAATKNGVAQVTLVGHVDSEQSASELIGRDPLYCEARDIDVRLVRHALSLGFPGENEGLVGLEPDLIGEHHVAGVITDALLDACLDWAGEDRQQRRHILTVLNRATRAEHGAKAGRAEAQLDRLIRTHAATLGGDLIKVAFETPGRLLDLCPALESQLELLDESALAAIEDELPPRSMALDHLSLQVAARRADSARKAVTAAGAAAGATPDVRDALAKHLALRLGTFTVRLSNLGRHQAALAASQEAVDILRQLAQTRPDACLPELAWSLNNLGNRLSNLGRHQEALAASQEGVDIRRRLAQTWSDAFLEDLASSLNNLGEDLSNLGRHEEALAPSQEAVDIYRRLAQMRPDALLDDLAGSLNNLGIRLSNLGRLEEALAASQEAVDMRRRLAQTRPDAFLSDLAMSLSNLSGSLSNLGRYEEVLAASQEAVDIYQRLAQTRPDAFLPGLAMSLNNAGTILLKLGRREEALAASQEAVDVYQRLAQSQPDMFLPDLALSLGALAQAMLAAERHAEAVAATREGLTAITPFMERYPEAFGDLARALRQVYLAACDKAVEAPDTALLDRVAQIIGAERNG
jgi:tetratricopeptide (TPR) repeat protein